MFNMKTLLNKLARASLSWRGLAAAAVVLGGAVQTSQAASADPSGPGSFTWDLVSSGAGQRGIAFITFSSDHTFRGYQMLAAIPPKTNSTSGARGGDNGGRGDSNNTSGKTNTFLFGFNSLDGSWSLNSKGQIVGFYSQVLNVSSTVTNFHGGTVSENLVNAQTLDTTNIFITFTNGQTVLSTNFAWANPPGYTQEYLFPNTNVTVDVASAQATNMVSFTGKDSGNKHLTLMCSTTFGKVTFKGIPAPAATTIDLSGNWIGTRRENGQQFVEFFDLVSFQDGNPFPSDFPDIANFPNLFFTTDGQGPAYTFSGIAMFSQQKKVGFTFVNDDGTLRSMIGTLKAKKFGATANTEGIEEPVNHVEFNATLQ
jgi:hypothetical protein